MQHIDIAVVGAGIGGAMISALNRDKNLILFEKASNLGGCASTFCKNGSHFNAGATTLMGLNKGEVLRNIFDKIDFKPNVIKSNEAFRVIQKGKSIDRGSDIKSFLDSINRLYPNKNNNIFWSKIKEIDTIFWEMNDIYFAKHNLKAYLKTAKFFSQMVIKLKFSLFESASSFIARTLGVISNDYKDFIDAQLLITLQEKSDNLSLLSMALGLSYPFHDVYYANGGMGSVIDGILKDVNVHTKEKILRIEKDSDKFILYSTRSSYKASKVILNSTIYDSASLFEDKSIKKYYKQFEFSDKSAFVVYLKLNIKKRFLHHYQIILEKELPQTISKSFFVSFSDIEDDLLSHNGLSVTISTHTKAIFWSNLSKMEYIDEKEKLEEFIIKAFLEHFEAIKKEHIVQQFSATSSTFDRYISRKNCGGEAISLKNAFNFPSCNTPFKNLYNVGDTVFASQGWSGIALGVNVLHKELNG
ncbi:MAG: FAD-dependent oxidoreductase [Campylobacterales bacterium]|nr:FAD-dependent oxidoreductase [Campylobacterota bacterium]MBD3842471.1 FAD-dependent oxidoreductase [Campylobacterales bacterium]